MVACITVWGYDPTYTDVHVVEPGSAATAARSVQMVRLYTFTN